MNLPNIPQPVADFGQKALNVLKTPITNITGGIKDYSAIKGQLNNAVPLSVMGVPLGPDKAALTGALGEARGRVIGGALQIGIPAAAAGMMLRNKLKRRREAVAGDNSMNKAASVFLWGMQKTAAEAPPDYIYSQGISSSNPNIDHATRVEIYRDALRQRASAAPPGVGNVLKPAVAGAGLGALAGRLVANKLPGGYADRATGIGAAVGGGLGAYLGSNYRSALAGEQEEAAEILSAARRDPNLLSSHVSQLMSENAAMQPKTAAVILWGLQKTAAPSPDFELHPSAVSSANSNIDHATRIKLYRESLQEHAASAVPGRLGAMAAPALGLGAIGALSGFGAVGNRTGALVGGGLGAATGALIGNMNRNNSIRNKDNAAATLAAAENDPELLRAHIAQMQAARDDYSADMAMLRDDMKEDRRLQTARDVGMAFANRPSASGPVVNNNIYR